MSRTKKPWFYFAVVFLILAMFTAIAPRQANAQIYCGDMHASLTASGTQSEYTTLLYLGKSGEIPGYPVRSHFQYAELGFTIEGDTELIEIRELNIDFDYQLDVNSTGFTLTISTPEHPYYTQYRLCEFVFSSFGTVHLDYMVAPCLGFSYPASNLWDGIGDMAVMEPRWVSCYPSEADYETGDNCTWAFDGDCDGFTVRDGYDCPNGACWWYSDAIDEWMCTQQREVPCLANHGTWHGAGSTDCPEAEQEIPIERLTTDIEPGVLPQHLLLEATKQKSP